METTTLRLPTPKSVLYKAGRQIGLLRRGIMDAFSLSGARPALTDDSAWIHPLYWGEGVGKGKPKTKADFVAQFQGWVYTCVKLNAQSVASTPLRLYVAKKKKGQKFKSIKTRPIDRNGLKYLYSQVALERYLTKSEEIEEVTEHRFLDLMNTVNDYHNARDLREFTTMFGDLTGEAYWLLIKDSLKIPNEIFVIPSQFIDPKFGETLDNAIEYYVYKRGNVEAKIPPELIVQFNYPNPHNTFTGFSCVRGIADAVYIQSQMNAFETSLFENRARVGGIFSTDENVSRADKERMKEQFKQDFVGSKRAGKHLFLPKGFKFNRDAMTPEELSFIEGRKMNREEICASFDIPFGAFDVHANRATSDTADYRHSKHGVKPRCDRQDEKINEKIMPLFDENLFVASDNPVPQDRELLLKERAGYSRSGIQTINEIREDMGLEAVEGGDIPLIDNRLVPLGSAPNPEQVEELTRLTVGALRERLG